MMGLETLLEAAKFLEYKAEVEARGEKGFPALPSSGSSSLILSSPIPNGYGSNHHPVIQNGIHYVSQGALPYQKNLSNNTPSIPKVPEPANGFKVSDHSYRRGGQICQSPTYEFNGGTNRASKGNNSSSSSSSSSINSRNSGTREVHNKLEKNRRAHLKECFELLKGQLPSFEDRKISNLAILRSSLRYIQTLKRKEREFEHEMERLAREKIALQQRLSTLKKDMLGKYEHLTWTAPEEVDMEMDTDSATSVDYVDGRKPLRKPNSPSEATLPPKNDSEQEMSNDSQHPLSLTINNHRGDIRNAEKKSFGVGHLNGLNGLSTGTGAISLVTTTKLSSSPLAAITVEKTANSPVGGASFVNTMDNSTSVKNYCLLNNGTLAINSKMEMGQYYEEEKMCK